MDKNAWLMLVATLGTFAILVLLIFFPVQETNKMIILAIAGPTLGFFFGATLKQPVPPGTVTSTTTDNTKGVSNAQTTVTVSPPGPLDPTGL